VSSIAIRGDYAATLYQNAGYAGNSTTFVSSDSDIDGTFIDNDRATSLRVRKGDCNSEPGVYVYEHSNLGGRCSRLRRDTASLRIEYVRWDTASSLKFIGDWVVTLYTNENFSGNSRTFYSGTVNLGAVATGQPFGHDRARSIRIMPRHELCDGFPGVYLYENRNFQGRCTRFTTDAGDLARHLVGTNAASSLRIRGDYRATLFENRDFNRESTVEEFTASDPDLSNNPIREDRASSMRVVGPHPEQVGVYRIQIRLRTGNVSDAGTGDDVMVSLNARNFTWVDYPRNDFQRNDTFTYDLLTNGISRMSDIQWITINKSGSDGWCIKGFDLLINNFQPTIVYTIDYPTCAWLDNNAGDNRSLFITFVQLHSHPRWAGNVSDGPIGAINNDEIISRIQAAVGHALHYTEAYWSNNPFDLKAVEIEGFDDPNNRNDRIHVDLDLEADRGALTPEIDIDIDFDIFITCSVQGGSAQIQIQIRNVRADVNWLANWLAGDLETEIEEQFPAITQRIGTGLSVCLPITVQPDGSVRFF
jgi:hypothetical protein